MKKLLLILSLSAVWLVSSNITVPSGSVIEGSLIGTTSSTATTLFYELYGAGTSASADKTVQMPLPRPGVLSNFYFVTSTAQPASGTLVCTLNINGSDTTIKITIAAGAGAGTFSDTTHTAVVAQGDLLALKITNNALLTSAAFQDLSILLR